MSAPTSDSWRFTIRPRLATVLVMLVLWSTGISARLVYLQVYRRTDYLAKADRQQQRVMRYPGTRGEILDRDGRVLAYSVPAPSVYAVPSVIENPAAVVTGLCSVLGDCSPDVRAQLRERLSQKKRQFAWVRRLVTDAEAATIEKLKLEGIGLWTESRRVYPNGTLMAPTLGYVNLDSDGLGGIERAWNKSISGKPGVDVVQIDAKQRVYNRTEQPSTPGNTVELTIDEPLQYVVERELAAGVAANRAAAGTAIVMDPATGEVLAMASVPTFDPNDAGEAVPGVLRNPAVENVYEPGSTFKIVTASAAIEDQVVSLNRVFPVTTGYIMIGDRRINDSHRSAVDLTFEEGLIKSSNIVAVRVGQMLGADRLSRYVTRFGFGARTGIGLFGETAGIVWNTLTPSALASVSMGYQVSVTPLQMATAASAVANGGQLMQPTLIRAERVGDRRTVVQPRVVRRVTSAETASILTSVMEEVVQRGTGKAAQIEGYRVAGKTGTASKIENGHYSKSKYYSSFVGFFPADKPRLTVLVVVDSASAGQYFGGAVAAPIFKRIAEAAIRQFGIPRSLNPLPPVLIERRDAARVNVSSPVVTPMPTPTAEDPDLVPDLSGLTAREALRRLDRMHVRARLHGDGIVVRQRPSAGTPLDQPGEWQVWLERTGPTSSAMMTSDDGGETRP
jgi:cell division protein FtsI (penicillin-binding protein 3)